MLFWAAKSLCWPTHKNDFISCCTLKMVKLKVTKSVIWAYIIQNLVFDGDPPSRSYWYTLDITQEASPIFTALYGNVVVPWWETDAGTTAAYDWTEPAAWQSERLYQPWGEEAGDNNILDERTDWWEMYMCTNVKLNGLVGAPFFNNRYYSVHVSLVWLFAVIIVIISNLKVFNIYKDLYGTYIFVNSDITSGGSPENLSLLLCLPLNCCRSVTTVSCNSTLSGDCSTRQGLRLTPGTMT